MIKEHSESEFIAALSTLVKTVIKCRREQPKETGPLRWWKMGGPIPSESESRLTEIMKDPIEGACLHAIHHIGQALFERGGTKLMLRIAEDALDDDGHSQVIVDKRWDGIGNDRDIWVS